jgi:signal transduction histidine kinase
LFRISDTGPGIAGEQPGDLFDRMQRDDPLDPSGRCGTGLGLHITMQLADQMLGAETGRSTEGKG